MEIERNSRNTNLDQVEYATIVGENKLLRASFSWMALAMLLTALSAYLFANVSGLQALLYTATETGLKPSPLAYIVMFAPLAFILVINFGLKRMSLAAIIVIFIAFSVVMGISLSTILNQYSQTAIVKVFLSTTALFGIMAVAGYTTKTDLTKFGSLLMIGLIGIVIASLINMFMQSSGMDYIISILGVIIFTGLTAYDVQKIKQAGEYGAGQDTGKLGIMGALSLYLNFLNLFLFLLDLFGGRRR